MGFLRSDDSAQIIVVAALLIAVLFVGLALVLNSAIYTENVATRDQVDTSEATEKAAATEDRLQRSIHQANYETDDGDFAQRRGKIESNVSEWDGDAATYGAIEGEAISAEFDTAVEGVRVTQDEKGTFMPANGTLLDEATHYLLPFDFRIDPLGLGDKKNWMIANDTAIRDFQMTVNRTDLEESRENLVDDLTALVDGVLTGSTAFWVEFHDEGDEQWRVYLVDDPANTSVTAVTTKIESGNETHQETCSAPGNEVTVRMTEGELVDGNGDIVECDILQKASAGQSNEVYYAGADEVNGTYRFIGDKPEDQFRDDLENRYGLYLVNAIEDVIDGLTGLPGVDDILEMLGLGDVTDDDLFNEGSSDDGPWTTSAVYDATVEVRYVDNQVSYTRNVSIVSENG